MNRLFSTLSLLLCACLTSCGYSFQGSGSALPPDIKRVNIPLAENTTPEPGLSLVVTEALRDRFERYGVLVVVDKVNEADAVLNSRVLNLKRETRTVTSKTDTAQQLTTVMTVAAELRRVSGPVLWRNPNLVVSKAFGTSSDVVVTSSADFSAGNLAASDLNQLDSREVSRGQEQEAIEDLAEEAARKIYDSAVLPEF